MVGIGSFFVLSQLPIREQLAACIDIVDLNTNFGLSFAANGDASSTHHTRTHTFWLITY
jgi:hypothetical protein